MTYLTELTKAYEEKNFIRIKRLCMHMVHQGIVIPYQEFPAAFTAQSIKGNAFSLVTRNVHKLGYDLTEKECDYIHQLSAVDNKDYLTVLCSLGHREVIKKYPQKYVSWLANEGPAIVHWDWQYISDSTIGPYKEVLLSMGNDFTYGWWNQSNVYQWDWNQHGWIIPYLNADYLSKCCMQSHTHHDLDLLLAMIVGSFYHKKHELYNFTVMLSWWDPLCHYDVVSVEMLRDCAQHYGYEKTLMILDHIEWMGCITPENSRTETWRILQSFNSDQNYQEMILPVL